MGLITLPRRSPLWKPACGAQINWSHPLATSLAGAWLFNELGGTTVLDATGKNAPGSLITDFSWATVSPAGMGADMGSGQTAGRSNLGALYIAGDFTVVALGTPLRKQAGNNETAYLGKWNSGGSAGTNEWYFGLNGWVSTSDFYPGFAVDTGSVSSCTDTNQWSLNLPLFLAGVRQGTNIYLYRADGTTWKGQTASGTCGAGSISNTGTRRIRLGELDAAGAYNSNAIYHYLYIFSAALQASAIQLLYAQPYDLLLPPRRRLWTAAAAGGTTFTRSLSDNIAINDPGPVRLANGLRNFSENIGITDTVPGRLANAFRVYSENIGITDSTSRLANALRVFADNIGISDSTARLANAFRLTSDNIGISDSVTRLANALRLSSDNIGITDTIPGRLANAFRLFSENIGITDQQSRLANAFRVFAENIGLTDSPARLANALRTFADNIGITDAEVSVRSILRILSDSLALSDSAARLANTQRLLQDNAGLTDSQTRLANALRFLADNAAVADSQARLANALRALADNVGMSDTASAAKGGAAITWLIHILENLAFSDLAERFNYLAGPQSFLVPDRPTSFKVQN